MPVNYARYTQTPYLTIGTTLTATGTLISAPAAGTRAILDYVTYWLVDPAGSNTVTLALGTVTLPPVILSSSRASFSLSSYTLGTGQAIVATLGTSGSVGFFGQYLLATD